MMTRRVSISIMATLALCSMVVFWGMQQSWHQLAVRVGVGSEDRRTGVDNLVETPLPKQQKPLIPPEKLKYLPMYEQQKGEDDTSTDDMMTEIENGDEEDDDEDDEDEDLNEDDDVSQSVDDKIDTPSQNQQDADEDDSQEGDSIAEDNRDDEGGDDGLGVAVEATGSQHDGDEDEDERQQKESKKAEKHNTNDPTGSSPSADLIDANEEGDAEKEALAEDMALAEAESDRRRDDDDALNAHDTLQEILYTKSELNAIAEAMDEENDDKADGLEILDLPSDVTLDNEPGVLDSDAAPPRAETYFLPLQPDVAAARELRAQVHEKTDPHPFAHCHPTVQVRVEIPVTWAAQGGIIRTPTAQEQKEVAFSGMLYAMDEFGNNKTVGGDEFYVVYTDNAAIEEYANMPPPPPPENVTNFTWTRPYPHATLVANVVDRNDGSYLLQFYTTPMRRLNPPMAWHGNGTLTVYFTYTCGIGKLPRPIKNGWRSGASTRLSKARPHVPMPPYKVFHPPNQGLNGEPVVDLGKYDVVLALGDSLMHNFIFRPWANLSATIGVGPVLLPMNNSYYKQNINTELDITTLPHVLGMLQDFYGPELARAGNYSYGKATNQTREAMGGDKIALVAGSAVWDVAKCFDHPPYSASHTYFVSHFRGVRAFVKAVREKYPNVDLYWKSPTALHIHRPYCYPNQWCIDSLRYISESRSRYLYNRQKVMMRELRVPFLDIYQAHFLSGDYSRPGDARHYESPFCALVKSWYYPYDKE